MIRTTLDKVLKENSDMSVYRLSQLTGLSEITITKFLRQEGKGVFYNTLDRICKALNCSPSDLIEYCSEEQEGGRQEP